MEFLWIIIIIVAILVLWVTVTYNRFVTLRERVKESWADIDVQLKRRYDLIPNIIATVKGYATHEEGVLTKVTEARNMAMGAQGIANKSSAENMLEGTLKSLFAVTENYPDLKANTNFLELQRELSDTENKIQAARRFYNTTSKDQNTMKDSFPSNIVANIFGFTKSEYFELTDESAKDPVKVQF